MEENLHAKIVGMAMSKAVPQGECIRLRAGVSRVAKGKLLFTEQYQYQRSDVIRIAPICKP